MKLVDMTSPTTRDLVAITLEPVAKIEYELTGEVGKIRIGRYSFSLEKLVFVLSKYTDSDMQERAAIYLQVLTEDDQNLQPIASYPGVLGGLLELIQKAGHERVEIVGARILFNLTKASQNDCYVGFFPSTIEALVGLLTKESPSLRELATGALANISGAVKVRSDITRFFCFRALLVLTELLFNDNNRSLQLQAATLLGNLAVAPQNSHIIYFPGVVEGMKRLLRNDANPQAHQHAVRVITASEWETLHKYQIRDLFRNHPCCSQETRSP